MSSVTITVTGPQITSLTKTLIENRQPLTQWIRQTSSLTIPGLGRVSVVDRETDYNEGAYETENHIVFKVEFEGGEVKFYKQEAIADSYGSRDWGAFYEVKGTPKTVTVYERV